MADHTHQLYLDPKWAPTHVQASLDQAGSQIFPILWESWAYRVFSWWSMSARGVEFSSWECSHLVGDAMEISTLATGKLVGLRLG